MGLIPAHLCVAKPFKQGQEAQAGALLHAPAHLAAHILLPIKAVGDSTPSQHQVDQVLAAVAMRRYQAGVRLIHVRLGFPGHGQKVGQRFSAMGTPLACRWSAW